MSLSRISPEDAGISAQHILDFIDDAKRNGLELHSMMLLRHGKIFADGWWKPYNKDSRHIMFSFTKSLTSTAIGFAWQEGLINLEDRLVDIFSESIPENPSENLKKCTVRDLLTMSCGHKVEIDRMGLFADNWISTFLNHPFECEPGTTFMYNTAGTNMLVEILIKKTGKNLLEFLQPRLFDHIGMKNVVCVKLPNGTDLGGAGSRLTTENMARFIQFVANKGTWNGDRLLKKEWFELATSKQVGNEKTSTIPDWMRGYGFQFWQCSPDNTFRADGAYGQFGVVCKDEDAVFIITSASCNFHYTLELLWKHIKNNFKDEPLPEDRDTNLILDYVTKNLGLTAPLSQRQPESISKYTGKSYITLGSTVPSFVKLIGGAGNPVVFDPQGTVQNPNTDTIQELKVDFSDYELRLTTNLGDREEILTVSMESEYNTFTLSDRGIDRVYGAVGTWITPYQFAFDIRCAEAATGTHFILTFTDITLTVSSYPSIPAFGGLGDNKMDDIVFELKK